MKTTFFFIAFLVINMISVSLFSQNNKIKIKSVNTGKAFTCIAADSKGNIWAGTKGAGIWNGEVKASVLKELNAYELGGQSDPNINNKFNIKTIAISKNNGGKETVWIGHNGSGTAGTFAGGGIDKFELGSKIGTHLRAERNDSVAQGMKLKYDKRDGLPSYDCRAIAIDKYNQVWSAHGYHDLFVTSSIPDYVDILTGIIIKGDQAGYYVTPGGLAVNRGTGKFDNVFTDQKIPYPAYTINTPISKTAGTRICSSVGTGNDEVWVGIASYETYNPVAGTVFSSCIARFDLGGKFLEYVNPATAPELPFLNSFASPRVYAIHFQKNRNVWIAFNQNKSIAVYEYDKITTKSKWIYIDKLNYYNPSTNQNETSKILPNGIKLNIDAPGIISSNGSKVFIGTTDGILMYKGKGDFKQDSSYVLINKDSGLCSNNIKGLVFKNRFLYAATDNGINQIEIPAEMEVYHIAHKDRPYEEKYENNYKQIVPLVNKNVSTADEEDMPRISCDGTTSTVFRYYTDDFNGFYSNDYKFGINADYDNKDTAQFGKLILKPKKYYDVAVPDYVDFIYRHPNFVDEAFVKAAKKITYLLSIYDKHMNAVFNGRLEYTLPPILLVHGVWTNVSSIKPIKNYFLNKNSNFKEYQIKACYRPDVGKAKNLPELPYPIDVALVKVNIHSLITDCEDNDMSAGKVTVIAHSRGGLYTRAYVEEIVPGLKYDDDVNALICLNTPHAGSQLANLVTDKRQIGINVPFTKYSFYLKNYQIGDIASIAIPDELDKTHKIGAQVLKVNEDYFINKELNAADNLMKFNKQHIPVHNIATRFDACKANGLSLLCSSKMNTITRFTRSNLAFYLFWSLIKQTPNGINGFMKYLFNGEENDFIVPVSSMEAGLNFPYKSIFPGENISHSTLIPGLIDNTVTKSEKVHDRLLELLSQNMHAKGSSFTEEGFAPPAGNKRLTYTFYKSLISDIPVENKPLSNDTSGVYICDDSTKLKIGDTLITQVYHQYIDKVILKYSSIGSDANAYISQSVNLQKSTATFKFPLTNEYYGKLMITAYGIKDTNLMAMHESTFDVSLNDTVKIEEIILNNHYPINVMNKKRAPYSIQALFTDSVTREISDYSQFKFYIRDTSIAKIKSNTEIIAENSGETSLIAVYNSILVDSVTITVDTNPYEIKTIFAQLSGYLSKKQAFLNWETYQEYKNDKFVVEKSVNNQKFDSIGVVKGAGTIYDFSEYSYADNVINTAKLFYRIRWKNADSLGTIGYSNVIELNRDSLITSVISIKRDDSSSVILYPNPTTNEVFLHVNPTLIEKEITFNLFNNLGELLIQKQLINTDNDIRINLWGLTAGSYYVTISGQNRRTLTHKKLVIISN